MNRSDKFTRRVMFFPAYEHIDGEHGVNMAFVLNGPLGAVTFIIWTNWHARQVQERIVESVKSQPMIAAHTVHPYPVDVGLHWTTSIYGEGDEATHEGCDFLDSNQFCYYDGSGLAAVQMFDLLVKEGDEAVWTELEAWYDSRDTTVDMVEFEKAKVDTAALQAEIQRPLEEAP